MPVPKTTPRTWLRGLLADPRFERRLDFLGRLPLFAGVPRRQLAALLQSLSEREYHKGEALCEQGASGRFLFLLESGSVEVLQADNAGALRKIAVMGEGAVFGEMAVLTDMPRTSTVVALEPVRAFLLYKTELEKLTLEEPEVAAALALRLGQLIAERLRAELATKGAAG